MKTEKRTVTIVHEFWACLTDTHYHKTAAVAQACIDKKLKQELQQAGKSPNVWTVEKQEELLGLRDSGMTFKAIGMRYGVCQSHANSLWKRFVRRKSRRLAQQDAFLTIQDIKNYLQQDADQLHAVPITALQLSARSVNCLRAEGIDCLGHLLQCQEATLLKTANLGKKSLSEIKSALALLGLSLR